MKIVPQLNPLPAGVSLEPKVTRVSVVPLAESEGAIPPLGGEEIRAVKGWREADRAYEARYKAMLARGAEEVKRTVGAPRAWWEKDFVMAGAEARVEEGKRRRDKWVLTGLKGHKEREMRDKKRQGKREGLRL